jgi:hypothetical protein
MSPAKSIALLPRSGYFFLFSFHLVQLHIKRSLGRQGLGFSGVAVPSGVRAATIPGASGSGAPRRATDGDAPMAGGQSTNDAPKPDERRRHP